MVNLPTNLWIGAGSGDPAAITTLRGAWSERDRLDTCSESGRIQGLTGVPVFRAPMQSTRGSTAAAGRREYGHRRLGGRAAARYSFEPPGVLVAPTAAMSWSDAPSVQTSIVSTAPNPTAS